MAVVALAPPLPLAILPAKVVLEPLAPTVKVAPQFTDELAANVVPGPAAAKPPSAIAVAPLRMLMPIVPGPRSKVARLLPVVP